MLFVTNFSNLTEAALIDRLRTAGVEAEPGEVVSSAMAAANLLAPGDRVLACAGPGVREAVDRRGARLVDEPPADVVVVGYHTEFDYHALALAMAAVRGGARLVATNTDPTYPTSDGLLPGNGALVAAVETASASVATVAGKPHGPMADLLHDMVGTVDGDPANDRHVVIGDLPATDGLLARLLGYRFGLVLSGVTTSAAGVEPVPDLVAADLGRIVEVLLG